MKQFARHAESLQDEDGAPAQGAVLPGPSPGLVSLHWARGDTGGHGALDRGVGGEDLVILGQIGQDAQPVQQLALHHVVGVQQRRDPELLLRHRESQTVVSKHIIRIQTLEINQMWMEVMDDSAEAESVPPACGHVENVDIPVACRDLFCPGLKGLCPCERHRGGLEITVMTDSAFYVMFFLSEMWHNS